MISDREMFSHSQNAEFTIVYIMYIYLSVHVPILTAGQGSAAKMYAQLIVPTHTCMYVLPNICHKT